MSRGLAVVACIALLASTGCGQTDSTGGAGTVSATACDPATSAAAATGFFEDVVARNPRGLPSSDDMAVLAPSLSARMRDAIEAARVRQRAAMDAYPDEKPPFVEGSLFSSLFEGPTAVVSADAEADAPARVAVTLQHVDGASTTWTDHAQLVCEDARWRIDDIVFAGDWAFASQGSLRDALETE